MRTLMIVKNDIRKRKGQSIVVLLLSFLITVLMATTVSVLFKCNQTYDRMTEKLKTPEVINIYAGNQAEEGESVYEKLLEQPEVKSAFLEKIILMSNNNSVKFSDEDWYTSSVFLRVKPREYTLAEGSSSGRGIFLPISLKTSQQVKLGDTVTLKFGNENLKLSVEGFFEDSFLGSSMIGIKQLFLTKEGFDEIQKETYSEPYRGRLLGMWLEPHGGESFSSVMKSLNEQTKVTSTGMMYMERTLLKTGAMLLTNILMVLIFLFSLLLLIILLITIRYMIASSLEDDFKEIGILHSLGYTKGNLIAGKMIQTIVLSVIGSVCGLAASVFTAPVLGGFALDGSGIMWHGGIHLPSAAAAVGCVFLFVLLVTWLSMRKIRKLSTVQAIRNGNEAMYFRKRYQISMESIYFLPLPLRLAVKNISVRLPQYLLLVVVCGFMIFSMVSISAMNENMHDVKKMSSLFGSMVSDISIVDTSEKTEADTKRFTAFMEELKKTEGIYVLFSYDQQYMSIDGQKMILSATSKFVDGNHQEPFEGRVPKYDNEIMMTEIAAEYLGKKIGDTVEIVEGDRDAEFLITGYYQSSNDAGKIAGVTYEGYKKLLPDYKYNSCELLLNKNTDAAQMIKDIKTMAKEQGLQIKAENVEDEIQSTMKDAQLGILALVVLFYVLAILMTGLITFLLAMILMKKQKREFAIQKSMGYPIRLLRLQFSLSFGLAGMAGAVLGVIMVYLFANRMFAALFRNIGITKFTADITGVSILLPVLILAGFLVFFSYFISRRIKKVGTRQLAEDA